jgi:hypothetical protein
MLFLQKIVYNTSLAATPVSVVASNPTANPEII